MKKRSIPRLAAPKVVPKDKRKEYLEGWKKLFLEIDSTIEVFHVYDGKVFDVVIKNAINSFDVDCDINKVCFFVKLDPATTGLKYLFGELYNHMFSDQDILEDILVMQQNDIPDGCQPKIKPWRDYYHTVCDCVTQQRTSITVPPQVSGNT